MNLNKKTKSFIVSIGIIVGFFLFKNPLFQLILKDDWVYKPSNNGVYIGLFNNYFWIKKYIIIPIKTYLVSKIWINYFIWY